MNIWDRLTSGMPQRYIPPEDSDFWFDGDHILCRTEIQAVAIFRLLDGLMPETTWTVSQYPPDDDDIWGRAGWYYVSAPGGIKE